jgi:SAM-dependent methyltransferase
MPAEQVYGLDLQFAAVRRAKRLLAGESVAYARRMIGRSYERAVATGFQRAATLVCGDALDAPFVPGAFDRVIALNLLDSVPHPRQLIAVVDALCAPGGEIVLSSPYAWQSNVMAEDERFGGADPAAALVDMLGGRGFTVVDEAELPWTLRRDARSTLIYRSHYVRARKGT